MAETLSSEEINSSNRVTANLFYSKNHVYLIRWVVSKVAGNVQFK